MKKVTYLMLTIILIFVICVCGIFRWRQQNPDPIPLDSLVVHRSDRVESFHFNKEGKLNINTATAQELSILSGIGNALAQQIIQYREDNGLYKSVYDLLNVKGIGETKLNGIINHICAE